MRKTYADLFRPRLDRPFLRHGYQTQNSLVLGQKDHSTSSARRERRVGIVPRS